MAGRAPKPIRERLSSAGRPSLLSARGRVAPPAIGRTAETCKGAWGGKRPPRAKRGAMGVRLANRQTWLTWLSRPRIAHNPPLATIAKWTLGALGLSAITPRRSGHAKRRYVKACGCLYMGVSNAEIPYTPSGL